VKRIATAAAVVFALGFASAGTAGAQIVYGYTVPGNGGVYSNRTVVGVGASQTYNSFYSPYTGGFRNQVYGSNWLGQSYGQVFGFNPWSGMSYNRGFYQPNYYTMPFGGFNYGFYRRW